METVWQIVSMDWVINLDNIIHESYRAKHDSNVKQHEYDSANYNYKPNMNSIEIALWDANELSQPRLEVVKFLSEQYLDIMLISGTHSTEKNNFHIKDYKIYYTYI